MIVSHSRHITIRTGIVVLSIVLPMLSLPCTAQDTPVGLPSDSDIEKMAFSDYIAPAGFFSPSARDASPYYENTISVTPNEKRQYPPATLLCANDYAEALRLSEDGALHSAYYRDLESTSENERYYEFRRVYRERPSDIILSRVYKCSYFVPSRFNWPEGSGVLGTLNKRPIELITVRDFVEYIWYEHYYRLLGGKVVSVDCRDLPEKVLVRLTHFLTIGSGSKGGTSVITVKQSDFSVSRSTGAVEVETTLLKKVYGKEK